jgi:hypothetical protein
MPGPNFRIIVKMPSRNPDRLSVWESQANRGVHYNVAGVAVGAPFTAITQQGAEYLTSSATLA